MIHPLRDNESKIYFHIIRFYIRYLWDQTFSIGIWKKKKKKL